MASPKASRATPPFAALMLSGAGALPFVVVATAALISPDNIAQVVIEAVLACGAVILSFIGGAHWGFASGRLEEDRAPAARRLLVASVLPSLVGWGALLFSAQWSALVLGWAFIAVLPLDCWARAHGLAPAW